MNKPISHPEKNTLTETGKEKETSQPRNTPEAYFLNRKNIQVSEDMLKNKTFDQNKIDAYQIDGRCLDLSSIDLSKFPRLEHMCFDQDTKFFDPRKGLNKEIDQFFKERMEKAKTPGLHIKKIHNGEITGEQITGKGVGIAILDGTLLKNHEEYAMQIKDFTLLDNASENTVDHGSAVTSIAAGKNVGVAPNADIYYVAGKYMELSNITQGIEEVIKKNETLPKSNRIRAISISFGITKTMEGYEACKEAIKKAEEAGIYVIYVKEDQEFALAGRNPESDPEEAGSYYNVSLFHGSYLHLSEESEETQEKFKKILQEKILIPTDARTMASPTREDGYTFHPYGGSSRAVPYIAGLFALCCEIQPEIDKNTFRDIIHKTATPKKIKGLPAKLINPTGVIKYLSDKKKEEKNRKMEKLYHQLEE